jgi:pyruvate formate lyase activating enzyme
LEKKVCPECGKEAIVASTLGVCRSCILAKWDQLEMAILDVHGRSRVFFDLPERPPEAEGGAACDLCVNGCRIPEGERGFCGLRSCRDGKLVDRAGPGGGFVDWYYDELPTNCVAAPVCPGCSSVGYPRYSYAKGAESGYKNLAVFYHACTFNCLYCQNWHFRERLGRSERVPASVLAGAVDEQTSCICYFGGDPASQMQHALKASRIALERNAGRILRICFETNGSMNPGLADACAALSLQSGGIIKFDLKAFHPALHKALTGADNSMTLANFRRLGTRLDERPELPLLTASTLLVPGYVEEDEVRAIARFIASVDPSIPYTLLAFYPHFCMGDLPLVPGPVAEAAGNAARAEGLHQVYLGNRHLLR